MNDNVDLKEICLELMRSAQPVYLTTIDRDGHPKTRAMFNLRNEKRYPYLIPLFEKHKDDFMILFSTNTSSPKIQDINENKAVSVYYCRPDESRGVNFGGNIEIVDDSELRKAIWHEGMERYYPSGYDDPDHTVLRLYPRDAHGWNQNHTFYIEL